MMAGTLASKPPKDLVVDARPGRLLKIPEVAERLSVVPRTVRRLIDLGELPTCRIGRAVRIAEEDLARYLHRVRR